MRKEPPPVEGTADSLRVPLSMLEGAAPILKGAAAYEEVTLAARGNF